MTAPARHPVRLFYGQAYQTSLSVMRNSVERFDRLLDEYGYTGRRVLGYKLPVWQRNEKWTDEQSSRFIRSIWMGIGVGTFMVNSSSKPELNQVLIDGQQRLRAIERYFRNEIAVLGEDGKNYYWNDLADEEQRHFLRMPFPWVESQYNTEEQMIEASDLLNFGGTPHTPEERASILAAASKLVEKSH